MQVEQPTENEASKLLQLRVKEVEFWTKRSEELTNTLATTKNELDALKEKMTTLTAEHDKEKSINKMYEAQLVQKDKEIRSVKAEMGLKVFEVINLKKEITDLEKKLKEKKGEDKQAKTSKHGESSKPSTSSSKTAKHGESSKPSTSSSKTAKHGESSKGRAETPSTSKTSKHAESSKGHASVHVTPSSSKTAKLAESSKASSVHVTPSASKTATLGESSKASSVHVTPSASKKSKHGESSRSSKEQAKTPSTFQLTGSAVGTDAQQSRKKLTKDLEEAAMLELGECMVADNNIFSDGFDDLRGKDHKEFGKQKDGSNVYPPHSEFVNVNGPMKSVENVFVTVKGVVSLKEKLSLLFVERF
jgi:hypothetical protein